MVLCRYHINILNGIEQKIYLYANAIIDCEDYNIKTHFKCCIRA